VHRFHHHFVHDAISLLTNHSGERQKYPALVRCVFRRFLSLIRQKRIAPVQEYVI
jgi:hypothetical protein